MKELTTENDLIFAKRLREARERKGLAPINPVKEFEFLRDGRLVGYNLIDPRQLLPLGEMEKSVVNMARTTLKLRFLDYIVTICLLYWKLFL